MSVFSRRNGYNKNFIEKESTSDILKRRILAAFYKKEFDTYDVLDWTNYTTGIEDMMIEMGVQYEFPKNDIFKQKNAEALQKYILTAKEWYIIYDFIERYLAILDEPNKNTMTEIFNKILEDEATAYRILDGKIIPIITDAELESIESAKKSQYDSVNIHLEKALALFSDRKRPDYENSIKESISAVESICSIITETNGKNSTLGKTIKKLKDKGINIHPSMESAFSSLHGYTSDEDGIRHGGIDFKNAPSEDAKYMLVTCSAFINYLIEKISKIKND